VSDLFAEHGLADFVELVSEVRNAMGVPELSELLDRIGLRDPHAFFQFAYRSRSLALISRAVIWILLLFWVRRKLRSPAEGGRFVSAPFVSYSLLDGATPNADLNGQIPEHATG